MGFMNASIAKNYLTTIFGILAGLPLIIGGSGIVLNEKWSHILVVTAGIGTIGLGLVAKAFNVHATQDEVNKATEKQDVQVIKAQLDAKDALKP
jgi:hypothetical protein